MIKTTYLSYKPIVRYIPTPLYALTKHMRFEKIIAENGEYICVVDNKIVTPEEGNALFIKLRKENPSCKIERVIKDFNNDEILNYLDNRLDKYTQYIDNYRQCHEAEYENDKIRNIMKAFVNIANK